MYEKEIKKIYEQKNFFPEEIRTEKIFGKKNHETADKKIIQTKTKTKTKTETH